MRKLITKETNKPIQQKAKSTLNLQEKDIQHLQFNKNPPTRLQQDMLMLHQAVGNRAVVQQLAQLQKRGAAAGASSIHNIAAAGVQGMGSRLPHYNRIQTAFGKHSIAHVQAYTGKQAAAASHAMGAKAYTTGNKVAFADSNPDVHTTAHETAHVFQQEAGVRLKDNVGKAGDQYEREADAIANSVVQGKSVESQLSRFNHKSHHKDRAMTMRKPVQRLMGIEAELTVPVSMEPINGVGATDDEKIRAFFADGVPERTPLVAAQQGFKVVSDHDQLGTMIGDYCNAINIRLTKLGKNPMAPSLGALGNKDIGNMEYTTDNGTAKVAYDEEDVNELKAFRQSIKDMATHMTNVVNNAKTGVHAFKAPGAGFQYGIPPLIEFVNFANANGLPAAGIKSMHETLINRVSDKLYVQINAGILPKGVSKYLNQLSKDKQLASLEGQVFNDDVAWVKLLTSDAATVAEQALSHTQGPSGKVKRSKSLRGLIALMVANIFGLYLNAVRRITGGRPQAKNRIAALPKTPLTNVLLELDKANRPDQWPQTHQVNLAKKIAFYVDKCLDLPPVDRINNGGPKLDQAANTPIGFKFDWKNWVTEILTNKGDSIFHSFGKLTQVDPHDHPRSKIIDPVAGIKKKDDHPRPFQQKKFFGGQITKAKSGAIVTELRFIQEHPQPNQLLALADKAIKAVKESNQ